VASGEERRRGSLDGLSLAPDDSLDVIDEQPGGAGGSGSIHVQIMAGRARDKNHSWETMKSSSTPQI
jgi:hypothetical protein